MDVERVMGATHIASTKIRSWARFSMFPVAIQYSSVREQPTAKWYKSPSALSQVRQRTNGQWYGFLRWNFCLMLMQPLSRRHHEANALCGIGIDQKERHSRDERCSSLLGRDWGIRRRWCIQVRPGCQHLRKSRRETQTREIERASVRSIAQRWQAGSQKTVGTWRRL